MSLVGRGRKPTHNRLVSVRAMVREDLGRLAKPRSTLPVPQRLLRSHHNIARFAALGLTNTKIAERTGMSRERVGLLLKSPAMVELVASYRSRIDECFIDSVDSYFEMATQNMLSAERHIADRIGDLEEEGELLPIRDALAISRDAADRFGYGKKSTNLNVNVDFAARLEAAITRSKKAGGPLPPSEGEGVTSLPSPSTLRRI